MIRQKGKNLNAPKLIATYGYFIMYVLSLRSMSYMIDSDRRPDSNRRPLLKSAYTYVIISNHGTILEYSQIGVLSKLAYL